jgi:phosphatidylglycerophosphate synthase
VTTLAGPPLAGPSLLVVLPVPPGAEAPSPDTVIAGLPLLRRIVLAAARAGFERVLVHPLAGPEPRLLEGTIGAPLAVESITDSTARLVLLPANVLPQVRWLRLLREMPLEPETVAVDSSGAAATQGAVGAELLRSAGEGAGAQDLIGLLAGKLPHVAQAADPAGRFALVRPGDARAAERWLLRSLIKDSEGFMSRHVERRLSLALTRRLVLTPITPNVMTLVSLAVGLLGAPFFLSADPLHQVVGGLLFLTHSILDGCDGELARLKFQESPVGARLDFWGDNLVHVWVFACMAIGWSQAAGAAWPLLPGALAVTGTAAAALLVSRRSAATAPAATARLAEAVANRDFIYLVILLACFGKAQWFLVLVALGTPIFMLLVRWGARRRPAA